MSKPKKELMLELRNTWLKCKACGAEAFCDEGYGRLSKVTCTNCWKTGHVVIKGSGNGKN